jgi:translation initiation factor 3 subunit L
LYAAQGDKPDFELPAQWLWDMIDEFVFQFEHFCTYRDRLHALAASSPADLQELKANQSSANGAAAAWSVATVLRYLNALVAKSKIRQQKSVYVLVSLSFVCKCFFRLGVGCLPVR